MMTVATISTYQYLSLVCKTHAPTDAHIFMTTKSICIIYVNSKSVQEAQLSQRGHAMLRVCLYNISFNIPTAQFFLLPITAASDLLVHKILLWLGYTMVKNFRRHLYSF